MLKKEIVISILGTCSVIGIAGCGGSSTFGTSSQPRIRAVDLLSTPTSVNVAIAGSQVSGVNNFGNVSSYRSFTNGNDSVEYADSSSGNPIINQSAQFDVNHDYTILGYQGANGPALMILTDTNNVSNSRTTVRFVKLVAGTSPVVDVYVTAPGADLASVAPTFSVVSVGSPGQNSVGYTVGFAAGTYEVRETVSGSKTPVIDQTFPFSGGISRTIVDDGTSAFFAL